jgi:hypothetical protein
METVVRLALSVSTPDNAEAASDAANWKATVFSSVLPPKSTLAVTSSAPALAEPAGDTEVVASPLAFVSAVDTLVTTSDRTALKVTTRPGTGLPLASLRTAVSSAGLEEDTVVVLALSESMAVALPEDPSTGVPALPPPPPQADRPRAKTQDTKKAAVRLKFHMLTLIRLFQTA